MTDLDGYQLLVCSLEGVGGCVEWLLIRTALEPSSHAALETGINGQELDPDHREGVSTERRGAYTRDHTQTPHPKHTVRVSEMELICVIVQAERLETEPC